MIEVCSSSFGCESVYKTIRIGSDPNPPTREITRLLNYYFFLLQFWYEAKNDEGHSYYWNVNTKGKSHFFLEKYF